MRAAAHDKCHNAWNINVRALSGPGRTPTGNRIGVAEFIWQRLGLNRVHVFLIVCQFVPLIDALFYNCVFFLIFSYCSSYWLQKYLIFLAIRIKLINNANILTDAIQTRNSHEDPNRTMHAQLYILAMWRALAEKNPMAQRHEIIRIQHGNRNNMRNWNNCNRNTIVYISKWRRW